MTASFLDVAHFFAPDSNKGHSICIALRFPSPHTGARIAKLLQRIEKLLWKIVVVWWVDGTSYCSL